MTPPRIRVPAAVAALLTLAAAPAPTGASQYNLDQAKAIVPRSEATQLRRAGLRSTLDILLNGRTPPERLRLAQRTGLPLERIEALVYLADLMRVRGIGPDVARLLSAAGVRNLAALQQCDPALTGAAILDVNQRAHLSTNPPRADSIAYWVGQARLLPIVLE